LDQENKGCKQIDQVLSYGQRKQWFVTLIVAMSARHSISPRTIEGNPDNMHTSDTCTLKTVWGVRRTKHRSVYHRFHKKME
jgi:hypothetical protein